MSDEERELDELKAKIHRERGFNTPYYKDKCLRRRIGVRMRARGAETFGAYATLLDTDPVEFQVLVDTLTVNVTRFFRDAAAWEAVREQVVPRLLEADGPVRVWSAGCASGEEPYSLAILLHEEAERSGRLDALSRVRIVGTDIDEPSLRAAHEAAYPDLSLEETPPDLRERWFSPGPPYRLREEAKRLVAFRRHDLLSEPAAGGQSLIVCRNVIIYFSREIQERLFHDFFSALRPGGFLVLGKVETLLGPTRSLFQPVSVRARIFQRPP